MKTLRKWLAPPVFEDEVKTEQDYLLHVIVWALICVPISYVIDRKRTRTWKARLHGGRIWVESQPGKGAAFHFMIPTNPIKE